MDPLTPHRRPPVAALLAGPPTARTAAQAVALLAVLAVPLALTVDVVAGAVAALVLGAVTLARVLALPGTLQALLGAALLLAAAASVTGTYETVPWVDVPAHIVVTGLLAAAVGVVLLRAGLLADPRHRRGRTGVAVTTAGAGAVLAVVWEVAEWAGRTFVDESIYVAYGDTVGDLAAGTAGSAVAGALVARWAR
ncbi:MAG TPA: hypothetical protein VKY79_10370 [Actinomycetaceae bacterium]|nr:hypothetical protein [Actinomycetaceae bacterium]